MLLMYTNDMKEVWQPPGSLEHTHDTLAHECDNRRTLGHNLVYNVDENSPILSGNDIDWLCDRSLFAAQGGCVGDNYHDDFYKQKHALYDLVLFIGPYMSDEILSIELSELKAQNILFGIVLKIFNMTS